MQASGVPAKVPLPFASSGTKNTIPISSQIGITPGAASYTDGFPPLTRTPLEFGGVPPFGQDMNGILFAVSAVAQWACAGGLFAWDSTFSTEIGGYPAGARVISASNSAIVWYNLTDNNTTNPDAGGAGWIRASGIGAPLVLYLPGTHIFYASFANYLAIVTGCGASGGGCQANGAGTAISGSGGGGGATTIGLLTGYSQGQSVSYTVGAVGTGGNGGASSIGSLTAAGGSAGPFVSTTAPGGAGGAPGTSGAINLGGGYGTDGQAGGYFWPGNGGASFWGGGGRGGGLVVSGGIQTGGGFAALNPGAGGGGTYDVSNTNFLALGGAGGPGIIVLFPLGATTT
jgi:hypothetical protein